MDNWSLERAKEVVTAKHLVKIDNIIIVRRILRFSYDINVTNITKDYQIEFKCVGILNSRAFEG